MRIPLLLVLLYAACAPHAPHTTPSAAPIPAPAPAAIEPAPTASMERPAFLDAHPTLFVGRIRAGIVRATPDGEALNDPTDERMSARHPVLDPDYESDATHPRVYCTDTIARVALYPDASSLETVALRGAVIRLDATTTSVDGSPGVYLASGTPLEIVERGDRVSRVRYVGPMLEAEGFVETARMGNVFAYDDVAFYTWNAELRAGARFLEAPGGRSIAVLEPAGSSMPPRATIIVRTRDDHTLLRLSQSNTHVIGWVESRLVTRVGEARGGISDVRVVEAIRNPPRFTRPVTLSAKTRLLDGANGHWIGLLNRDTELERVEACESDAPRVEVPTCLGPVRLWTAPPL